MSSGYTRGSARYFARLRPLLPVFGLACLLALSASLAEAASSRAEIRKSVENSMLVTGTIDIAPDGSTRAFKLDQPDKLPQPVRNLLDKAVPKFAFEPPLVDGKPVLGRARMGLRVVANQQDDGNYRLRVGSASFGEDRMIEGETVTRAKLAPPRYPEAAYMRGVTGTVYLLVKVDKAGNTADVLPEQVNLRVLGNAAEMERFRKILAEASASAARRWRFKVPTRGPAATQSEWVVRVPVDFRFHGDEAAAYGKWEAYVPGPRLRSPSFDSAGHDDPDALVAGGVQQLGRGPKLLSRQEG